MKRLISSVLVFCSFIFFVSWGEASIEEPEIKTTSLKQYYQPLELDVEVFYTRLDVNEIVEIYHSKNFEFYDQISHNSTITHYIIRECIKQNVPVNLAFAVAGVESRFNPKAINRNKDSSDYGLFQLNDSYRPWPISDFFNIEKNTTEGVRYLKEMLTLFNGDVLKAVAAYNCGPHRVKENKIPKSTKRYVKEVVNVEDQINIGFNNFIKKNQSIYINIKQ